MVQKILDVFPEALPRMTLDREVEFEIKLAHRAEPISKVPYRMAPAELKALKDKLHDLLEKKQKQTMFFSLEISSLICKEK